MPGVYDITSLTSIPSFHFHCVLVVQQKLLKIFTACFILLDICNVINGNSISTLVCAATLRHHVRVPIFHFNADNSFGGTTYFIFLNITNYYNK